MHKRKLTILCNPSLFPQRKRTCWRTPHSSSSKLLQRFLFIRRQALLRATCRTKNLDVSSFEAKRPSLLDSHYPVTRLFLENLHRTHCHQGVDNLRALVQQRCAINSLRTGLRTIVLRCGTCRKHRAETLSLSRTFH